ncbi:hypothetical protein [Pseudomonas sp. RL_15y_Pfl2_60]|uniref:hypothetical protein n=1 Tax=Pseudomonas sp. RL_15y_Pfl2_60 TaxID=3088709 RepID=UPI0030DB4705
MSRSILVPGFALKPQALELMARVKRRQVVKKPIFAPWSEKVPVSIAVKRDSVDSTNYLVTLQDSVTSKMLAIFTPVGPSVQWFQREAIYVEVLAQAYEYSSPRLGQSRWPTLSETANNLLFNISEGSGEAPVATVPARVDVAAAVDGVSAVREALIVEKMDDGQWRVAGYGATSGVGLSGLDLEVTTSGTVYAIGLDDYGQTFVPGGAAAVGDRVRPTVFTGWLYQITEAGNLPSSEPEWWTAEGDNPSRLLGTARAIAVRYYRPLAHGPVTVELT